MLEDHYDYCLYHIDFAAKLDTDSRKVLNAYGVHLTYNPNGSRLPP